MNQVMKPAMNSSVRQMASPEPTSLPVALSHPNDLTVVTSMHEGGPVMTDGVYRLKKGEHVLTAPEAARAKKHALMHAGMRSLASMGKKQMKGATSGEPTKMDKPMTGHTVSVRHIKVRPEMNQGAKSAHTEGNKMPTMRSA